MYRIVLLIEKNCESANEAQQILKTLFLNAISAMFQNKKRQRLPRLRRF